MLNNNSKLRSYSISNLHQNQQSKYLTSFRTKQQNILPTEKQQKILSTKKLPKISQALFNSLPQISQIRKQKKNKTKQLSFAIEKYLIRRIENQKNENNINDSIYIDVLQVIKKFSQTEHNFQNLFQNLFTDLKSLICFTGGNAYFQTRYNIQQGDLYKKICQQMNKQTNIQIDSYEKAISQHKLIIEQSNHNLNCQCKIFQLKEQKYIEQVQKYKKMVNKQYIIYLQQKVQETSERISQIIQSEKKLIEENQQLIKQKQIQKQSIHDLNKQLSNSHNIIQQYRQSKKEYQNTLKKIRDRFDQLNLKMVGMKNVIQTVQGQSQKLKSQRNLLVKRSAFHFGQLTPRPKYTKLFNFNQKQLKNKLITTQQITSLLIQSLSSQHQQTIFQQLKANIFNKKQMEYDERLLEIQRVRSQTIQDISQSKYELTQVRRMLIQP